MSRGLSRFIQLGISICALTRFHTRDEASTRRRAQMALQIEIFTRNIDSFDIAIIETPFDRFRIRSHLCACGCRVSVVDVSLANVGKKVSFCVRKVIAKRIVKCQMSVLTRCTLCVIVTIPGYRDFEVSAITMMLLQSTDHLRSISSYNFIDVHR